MAEAQPTTAPDGPWNWSWQKLSQEAGNMSASLQGNVNEEMNTPKMPWEMSANELSTAAGNGRQLDPTYSPAIQQQAQQTSEPTLSNNGLFARLINTESGGNHLDSDGNLLTSSKGAKGITQLMPATAGNPGYGVTPLQNNSVGEYVRFGRDYLNAMINHFNGNQAQGVAAYNAGPGAVQKAIQMAQDKGGNWMQYVPSETRKYVNRIVNT